MNTPMNRRILLIDDTPAIHEDFRKILMDTASTSHLDELEAALFGDAPPAAAAGFELDSANQGQEGLARVCEALQADRPYAMAFVDMRMPPGWDGVETIEHLWKHDPRMQIVICTAFSDYSWDEVFGRLDAKDRLLILKKPFDNIEVYQLASALTAKWQMTQQATLQLNSLEALIEERTLTLRKANEALQAEIAERKLLESQLLHAQKMESIGQLAAGIAHEINTPIQYIADNTRFLQEGFLAFRKLTSDILQLIAANKRESILSEQLVQIETAVEELDIDYLQEETPKAIRQSLDGIERVTRIVQAMKHFSHPGAADMTPTDLNRAIENTIIIASNEWKYVADIVRDFDSDLPLVPCHPGDFNQVTLNLIVNAAHAISDVVAQSGGKGIITIRTRRLDNRAEIRIEDTGTGIPDAARSRIFDPFFTTKEVGKGTGQGLAIAHYIVTEKHGGQILFETEMGKGTAFILRLPLDATEMKVIESERPEAA